MTAKKSFYGWKLAVVAWFLYGTQAVGFYGWGFYLPETLDELGLTRAQGGIVFGVSTLAGGLVSPFIGMSIGRFGLRATMTFGFMVSALGYLFAASIPALTGWVFDTQGTYEPAFLGLAVLTLVGSLTASIIQAPERVVATSKARDGGELGERHEPRDHSPRPGPS